MYIAKLLAAIFGANPRYSCYAMMPLCVTSDKIRPFAKIRSMKNEFVGCVPLEKWLTNEVEVKEVLEALLPAKELRQFIDSKSRSAEYTVPRLQLSAPVPAFPPRTANYGRYSTGPPVHGGFRNLA
ncbi:hypothetical protein VT84_33235 [Gemmata sp. SH-PL17]|uniref:hypothetical protein n=1 Tax=Gemmata sp. SH-PL17 TaxID=1630693 RepID=UPI00078E204A|nr:hypothetical protein [Gemmata sp. SH-PL17]AMV29307.1 hypothetical protein VT84_33235 [Gemmata sp. SH-PL17]